MIQTADYSYCKKLMDAGMKLSTEFYYNKKTKNRFPGNDVPKAIKDFFNLFVPAPASCELDGPLPVTLKEGKNIFLLTEVREKKAYKVSYRCDDYENFGELYPVYASTAADAKINLLIKLIKDGKVKISN